MHSNRPLSDKLIDHKRDRLAMISGLFISLNIKDSSVFFGSGSGGRRLAIIGNETQPLGPSPSSVNKAKLSKEGAWFTSYVRTLPQSYRVTEVTESPHTHAALSITVWLLIHVLVQSWRFLAFTVSIRDRWKKENFFDYYLFFLCHLKIYPQYTLTVSVLLLRIHTRHAAFGTQARFYWTWYISYIFRQSPCKRPPPCGKKKKQIG